jgi:hypothetical protein
MKIPIIAGRDYSILSMVALSDNICSGSEPTGQKGAGSQEMDLSIFKLTCPQFMCQC